MFYEKSYKISSPIIQEIQDAILLGNIRELMGVLELVKEDEYFPLDLRYGLEALLYFRIHYGKDGVLAPVEDGDRQKKIQMEISWGRELIESIGHYPDMTETKYA